jgi:flagellar motor switch protein FliN
MAESELPTDESQDIVEEPAGDTLPDDQEVMPLQFDQLTSDDLDPADKNVNRFDDVTLQVAIELGRVTQPIREILEWREGSVIETTKLSGQPMEIMVNGRLFGKGEVVVVGDNLAIRITDLMKPDLE